MLLISAVSGYNVMADWYVYYIYISELHVWFIWLKEFIILDDKKKKGGETTCLEFSTTNVAFGYLLDRQPNTLVFLPFLIRSKRKKKTKKPQELGVRWTWFS